MKVVGIDLAGSEKRNTGICILDENLNAKCLIVKKDEEILEIVKREKPDLIAIDAPLSLPIGRKSLDEKTNIHFRECDKQLWRLKIKFFPITLGPMRMLTQRGIKIRRILEKNYKVIEVYPGATQDILKIPRKQKGLKFLFDSLKNLGIKFEREKLSGDELDAVTAAYTGYLFLKGKAEELGNKKEGTIVIPRLKNL